MATTDPYANGVCPFGEDAAPGAGCIKPAGHDGPHLVTPGDVDLVDDPICGDEYDADACELEPGHTGLHLAGNLGWAHDEAQP